MTKERWGNIGLGALAVLAVLMVVLAFGKLNQASVEPMAVPASGGPSAPVDADVPSSAPTPTPTPTGPAKPKAVFIGDSYTTGVGGDGTKWTSLVAEEFGWEEVNLGYAGTGYVTSLSGAEAQQACGQDTCPQYGDVVPDAVEAEPDVVVVSGGRNDGNSKSIVAEAEAMFRELRKQLPDAEIYVLSPIWDDDYAPTATWNQISAVKKAAGEAGATYVDIEHPLTGRSNLISEDGVHPNADGYRVLGKVAAPELGAAN